MLSTLLVERIQLVLAFCLVLHSKEVTSPGTCLNIRSCLVAGEGWQVSGLPYLCQAGVARISPNYAPGENDSILPEVSQLFLETSCQLFPTL